MCDWRLPVTPSTIVAGIIEEVRLSGFNRLKDFVIASAICATVVLAAVAAPAQAPTARAFVEAIYKTYLGKDAKGVLLTDEAAIRRYFAPPLADALVKDRSEADKRGDAPTLDGDPFIDGQDWEISRLSVNVTTAGTDAAIATVTFTNFRKPVTVTLALVKTAAGWRIADIKGPSWSLKALMKVTQRRAPRLYRQTKASLILGIRRKLKHHR